MRKVRAMTVKEIVIEYLKKHGFDGLVTDEGCGCDIADIAPCGGDLFNIIKCEPGYKILCEGGEMCDPGDCEFHISAEKPKKGADHESVSARNKEN